MSEPMSYEEFKGFCTLVQIQSFDEETNKQLLGHYNRYLGDKDSQEAFEKDFKDTCGVTIHRLKKLLDSWEV